jgi:gliding motility-associated-like protein
MKILYKIIFLFILIIITSIPAYSINKAEESIKIKTVASPSGQITGDVTVCLNETAPLVILEVKNDNNGPYTFTYTINGGAPLTIQTNNSDKSVTVSQPTNVAGAFTYILTGVKDKDNNTVAVSSSNTVVITVNPLPVVDFTFTDNQCSGTAVQFNSNVSGNSPFTYTWNFGDSDTSSQQNPTHTYNAPLGCSTSSYIVSLTITDVNKCSTTIQKTITIKQLPDIAFSDTVNSFNPFNNCNSASSSNPNFSITVANVSLSSCISSFAINWGDGNIQNNITFPVSHTYNQLGAFQMVITATGSNGCQNSKTYTVKNESNPAGSLSSPGSTVNLCAPTPNLAFVISSWGNNSPNTLYSINYGDGTPNFKILQSVLMSSIYYNSGNPSLSQNYPVPYSYTATSCPNASITATLIISNSCGSTTSTISPISILRPPTSKFTNPAVGCVNSSILFTNSSTPSLNQNCIQGTTYEWDFGDGKPVVIIMNSSSIPNINHTYTTTGNFTVTLKTQGYCPSSSVFTSSICIEAPLLPQFNLDKNEGCTPLAITTTNTSNLVNSCATPTYLWNVIYASSNCGTSSSFTYTNGTSATSVNPRFNFVNPGTYTISLSTTNSCGTVKSPVQTVIVKQPPTVGLPSISTICQTSASTTINPTAIVVNCGTTAVSYEWSFPSGTPATSSSANPGAIIYSVPGTYSYSLKVTNECGSTTTTSAAFTIKPTPTVNDVLNQTKCKGALSDITFGGALAGTVYTWANNNTSIGLVAAGTGNIAPFTLLNTGNTILTATITVTPSLNGCSGTSKTFTITVHPDPTVNAVSDKAICNNAKQNTIVFGSTVAGITFSWSNDNTAIGLAANGAGDIPSFTATNTTTAPIVSTITVTPSNVLGCSGTPKTFKITVNPTPSSLTLGNQEYCNGALTGVVSFSNSVTGTTYAWTNSNTAIGLMASGTGNIPAFTATNSSANPISGTITVTPTANGCSGSAQTFIITVNPSPIVTFSTTDQTICSGDNSVSVTLNSTTAGATFNWIAIQPIGITGTATSGANVIPIQLLTNSTNAAIVITYKAKASISGGPNCAGEFLYTITVKPKPFVAQQTQTICSSGTFTITPANNVGGNIVPIGTTYSWSIPTVTAGVTGGASGVNQPSITGTLTNLTNSIQTATYTVTPTTNGCTGLPIDIVVTVNPTPTTLSLTNQIYCNGVITPITTLSNAVSATTYTWTNSNTAIGLPANGIGNIPSFTATNTTSSPITATISVIATANGCSRPAEIFTITVNPSPAVTFSPIPQIICSGSTSAIVALTSSTAGATFSWTATQPAGITGVVTSGTDTIPAQTLTNTTAVPITVTYNATAITAGGSACPGAVYSYTITVKPKPSITEVFATSICGGSAFTITPSSSASNSIPAGTTYSWSTPTVTGGLSGGAPGIAQSSITGTLNNPTTITQTATYTVTPTANSCSGSPFTITVTVNATPIIANQTASICSEGTFTVTPINGGATIIPTGTTYTWAISSNPNISGQLASNTAGITTISQTLTNLSNTVQTLIYTVTPTSGVTGNCVGPTFTITVTVNSKPYIANSISTAICSGTSFTVAPINGSGNIVPVGTTYIWGPPVSNPLGVIIGGTAQATGQSNISQTLTNTTNDTATLTYTVTPTSGSCIGVPFTIVVTVNPSPLITASLGNQDICSGISSILVNLSTTTPGATIAWTCIAPSGITGANLSGTDTISAQTLVNTTNAPIAVIYKVVATTGGSVSCDGAPFLYTINVNPSPAVLFSPSPQTICSNDTSAVVVLNSSTAGATISWTATQPAGITGVVTSGTNTIPVQNLINSTNSPIIVTYQAIATAAGGSACPGAVYNYTITVNPRPNVSNQTKTICNNQSFTIAPINGVPTLSTIVPSGTLYTWTVNSNSNITGAFAGNGTTISQTLNNSSNSIQTILYNVVPFFLNCAGTSFTVEVTVYPSAQVVFSGPNQTICNNTNSSLVNLSSTTLGNVTLNWTAIAPAGISGALLSGTDSIPIQTLTNSTVNALTISYTAIATFTNNGLSCQGPPTIYTITVNPTTLASGVLSNYNGYAVSVFGNSDGFVNVSVTGGSGSYTYSWSGPNGFTAVTQDINNVPAGSYTVTINDGYCAPVTLNFILTQPPELLIQEDLSAHINLLCFGYSNGALGVTITQGSVAPYDYQLVNSSGTIISSTNDSTSLNAVFTGLIAGTYSIKVIDANNGTKTLTGLKITQPNDILITPTATAVTCYHGNDGTIALAISGGISPYKAVWGNLATGFYQDNLSAGDYTITVTDANNCSKLIKVNVPEAPIFDINPVVKNISCHGAHDGSIVLNVIGGIPSLSLTWSDGSTAGTTRNNLGPGTYSVAITDGKPCHINRTFVIIDPQEIALDAITTQPLDCSNANSGAINLNVSGGTPPFKYLWSNGATTEDLLGVTAGNYTVIVKDVNGCSKQASYVLTRPSPIVLTVDTKTLSSCENHTVEQYFTAQTKGGVPPYQFTWSSGTVSGTNNQTMTTSQDGLIMLQSTDAIGCSASYSFDVNIPILGQPSFDRNSKGYTAYGIYSINDPIQFTNTSTGDFVSVAWDFGDGSFSTELNPVHTYVNPKDYVVTQTVTYPFGCVYVQTITLLIEKGYVLVVPTAFTPNNDKLNDTFRPVTKALKNVRLEVYDSWGSLIYSETGEVLRGWDAKIKGSNAENGNYFCVVSAETFYGTILTEKHPFVIIK